MNSEKRTLLYLAMADAGTAAIVVHIAAQTFDWPDFMKGLPIGMSLVALAMLLFRKLRDEYVESLWNAGTSLAFVMLVIWFLFLPFGEGVMDGIRGIDEGKSAISPLAPSIAILAFFAGFQWKRWRTR